MTLLGLGRRALGALLLGAPAIAQSFSYPDFSNVSGLQMNGNAGQSGSVLRVTPSANGQRGSVFYDQATRVTKGFSTTFTFQFSALTGGGADGMAFVIQNAAKATQALGDTGSGMGYAENPSSSIENSIAVELDTWDSGVGDPDDDHVSVHTGGTGKQVYDEAFSIGRASVPGDMSDGAVHTAMIRYQGGLFEVFVDDLVNPLISVPYDFTTGGLYTNGNPVGGLNLINGESAWVGFSAGTGGAAENHDVLSWEWTDAYVPIGTNYCGPANKNSTGMSAVVAAFGSDVAASNSVDLTAALLPANQTGYFLASLTQGFIPFPGGSQGNLCVSGKIGRYKANVLNSGPAGEFLLALDLTNTPTPNGPTVVLAGETWFFQAWFQDTNPNPTSNFTDGIGITFL